MAVRLDVIFFFAVDHLRRVRLGGFHVEGQKGIVLCAFDREGIGGGACLVAVVLRRFGPDRDLAGAEDGHLAVRAVDGRNRCVLALRRRLLLDGIGDVAALVVLHLLDMGLGFRFRVNGDGLLGFSEADRLFVAHHWEGIAIRCRGKDVVVLCGGRDPDRAGLIEGDIILSVFLFDLGRTGALDIFRGNCRSAFHTGGRHERLLLRDRHRVVDGRGEFEVPLQPRGVRDAHRDLLLVGAVAVPVKFPSLFDIVEVLRAFRVRRKEGVDREPIAGERCALGFALLPVPCVLFCIPHFNVKGGIPAVDCSAVGGRAGILFGQIGNVRRGKRKLDLGRTRHAGPVVGIALRHADRAVVVFPRAVIDDLAFLFQGEHLHGQIQPDLLCALFLALPPVEAVNHVGSAAICKCMRKLLVDIGPEGDHIVLPVPRVLEGDLLRLCAVKALGRKGRRFRVGANGHRHTDADPPAVLIAADALILRIPFKLELFKGDAANHRRFAC